MDKSWRYAVIMSWLTASVFSSASSNACSARIGPGGVPQLLVPQESSANWEKQDYYIGLLELILAETTAEFGPCEVLRTDNILTRMRSVALINTGMGVDLFWATTSVERESLMRPIRIPLLKGLMGYKILLIRPADQPAFSKIQTVQELQALRAGVGADWPDKKIFLANGIPVVSSTNYESLFKMLAAKRFDFFPRGANEVWSEYRNHADINLHVEEDLVLVFPAPVYFFVSANNTALELRLERGLRKIIASGAFDRYFFSHSTIIDVIERVRVNQRRKIYLTNPLLPKNVPLDVAKYWLYPWYTGVATK